MAEEGEMFDAFVRMSVRGDTTPDIQKQQDRAESLNQKVESKAATADADARRRDDQNTKAYVDNAARRAKADQEGLHRERIAKASQAGDYNVHVSGYEKADQEGLHRERIAKADQEGLHRERIAKADQEGLHRERIAKASQAGDYNVHVSGYEKAERRSEDIGFISQRRQDEYALQQHLRNLKNRERAEATAPPAARSSQDIQSLNKRKEDEYAARVYADNMRKRKEAQREQEQADRQAEQHAAKKEQKEKSDLQQRKTNRILAINQIGQAARAIPGAGAVSGLATAGLVGGIGGAAAFGIGAAGVYGMEGARKANPGVANKLDYQMDRLQAIVGHGLVPILDKFANVMEELGDKAGGKGAQLGYPQFSGFQEMRDRNQLLASKGLPDATAGANNGPQGVGKISGVQNQGWFGLQTLPLPRALGGGTDIQDALVKGYEKITALAPLAPNRPTINGGATELDRIAQHIDDIVGTPARMLKPWAQRNFGLGGRYVDSNGHIKLFD
jgi:hypothetical protein